MEPQIQYAKTSDGVNIAYWTLGDGSPLVMTPGSPLSPTLRSWRSDEGRRFYERLAAHRQVIRYDNRGFGESKSGMAEASLDAWVSDLGAVVDRLELSRFPLLGYGFSVPIAIAYAARFPERVSKLVLFNGSARGGDSFNVSRINAARQTAEEDPEFFLRVIALEAFGWSASQHAEGYVAAMMEENDRSFTIEAVLALLELDVTDVLPALNAPVLLLHRRHVPLPPLDAVRSLAADLANARLFVLEGDAAPIYLGDIESVLRAIDDFLKDDAAVQTAAIPPRLASAMTAILFADIADSTALTERLGDALFRDRARDLDTAMRTVIRECAGTAIEGKLLGDGVLAVFTSASQAITAALRCAKAGEEGSLPLHLGIHAGDVIREENNVYGGAVNVASRISGLSAPGEVLVSETVRSLARTSAGGSARPGGEPALMGVGAAVRVWAVREGGA